MVRRDDGPVVRKEWLIAMAIVAVVLIGILLLVGPGSGSLGG